MPAASTPPAAAMPVSSKQSRLPRGPGQYSYPVRSGQVAVPGNRVDPVGGERLEGGQQVGLVAAIRVGAVAHRLEAGIEPVPQRSLLRRTRLRPHLGGRADRRQATPQPDHQRRCCGEGAPPRGVLSSTEPTKKVFGIGTLQGVTHADLDTVRYAGVRRRRVASVFEWGQQVHYPAQIGFAMVVHPGRLTPVPGTDDMSRWPSGRR